MPAARGDFQGHARMESRADRERPRLSLTPRDAGDTVWLRTPPLFHGPWIPDHDNRCLEGEERPESMIMRRGSTNAAIGKTARAITKHRGRNPFSEPGIKELMTCH